MAEKSTTTPTKLCPTCGTRVSEDAARCLVCGSDLAAPADKSTRSSKEAVRGSRMPEVTISLPAALGLLALFLSIGAVLVYFAMQRTQPAVAVALTETPTITMTLDPTASPTPLTPTVTNTPEPSPTPLAYTVKSGDTCGGIAVAFGVSVQSIVLANNLPADCSALFEGQNLQIPQPTPTSTPMPTATMSPAEATEQACGKFEYTVQENDTLSSISLNFAVSVAAIRDYNGLVNDTVRFGQVLVIPLCERQATPGPSPTPTPPPPYPAPNLLLPPDGAPFTLNDESITVQWASVGTLRENESYQVIVEDITEGEGRRVTAYVTDTKYILPASFRPNDATPHVMRWYVLTVRQVGTDEEGEPIWEPAGAASTPRVFSWSSSSDGAAAPQPSPTP